MRLLPHTIRIFIAGGLLTLFVFAVFLYLSLNVPENKNLENDDAQVNLVQKNITETLQKKLRNNDRDKDGLLDWEEALWNTDPNNPDTDNDGTTDGDEVDLNRNPLKKGPNDYQNIKTSLPAKNSTQTNTTEAFSQQFFIDYMDLRKSGNLKDPAKTKMLLEKAQKILSTATAIYNISDIIITRETPETIRAFGNQIGSILKIYGGSGNERALDIVETAVVENKPDEIKKLDPILKSYKDIRDNLLTVSVPNSAASAHLKLINSVSSLYNSLVSLRNLFVDPLQALVKLKKYTTDSVETAQSLKDLGLYFKQKNITFNENEDGYLLNNLPF